MCRHSTIASQSKRFDTTFIRSFSLPKRLQPDKVKLIYVWLLSLWYKKKKIILELEVCRQSPVYLRGSLNARFLMERDTGDQSIGKSNCLFWWLKMGLAIRCVSLVVWVAVFEYYCNQSLPELNEAIVHLWPGQPCYCLELQLKWSLAHLSQYSNYPKTLATTIEGF